MTTQPKPGHPTRPRSVRRYTDPIPPHIRRAVASRPTDLKKLIFLGSGRAELAEGLRLHGGRFALAEALGRVLVGRDKAVHAAEVLEGFLEATKSVARAAASVVGLQVVVPKGNRTARVLLRSGCVRVAVTPRTYDIMRNETTKRECKPKSSNLR